MSHDRWTFGSVDAIDAEYLAPGSIVGGHRLEDGALVLHAYAATYVIEGGPDQFRALFDRVLRVMPVEVTGHPGAHE